MRDRHPSWLRYVARETVAERSDKRRPRVPAQLRKEPGLSAAATTRPTPARTAQQPTRYAVGNARQRRRRHATRARNAARTHDTFCASTRSAKPAAHRRATRPRTPRTPSRQVQRDSNKRSQPITLTLRRRERRDADGRPHGARHTKPPGERARTISRHEDQNSNRDDDETQANRSRPTTSDNQEQRQHQRATSNQKDQQRTSETARLRTATRGGCAEHERRRSASLTTTRRANNATARTNTQLVPAAERSRNPGGTGERTRGPLPRGPCATLAHWQGPPCAAMPDGRLWACGGEASGAVHDGGPPTCTHERVFVGAERTRS